MSRSFSFKEHEYANEQSWAIIVDLDCGGSQAYTGEVTEA